MCPSKLDTEFCGFITAQVAVAHVRECFQDFHELGTMFLIFAVFRYFVAPIIVKAVVVSLLDNLVFSFVAEDRRVGL